MAIFQTSLTFLTFKQDVTINTVGTESINLSSNHLNEDYLYEKEKYDYLSHKQQKPKYTHKIRESVKELEQIFSNYRCIHLKWEAQDTVLLFFNSGMIASITFDEKKLNIQKVIIDHTLCGKLVSDHVTDIILSEKCLLICYSEPKLTYIHISKQISSFSNKFLGPKKGRLLGFEPLITTVDVIGPSSRRLEKKLSLNNLKDCALVWWRFTSNDVWPWMPVSCSVDRVNMIMYDLNDSSMEIICTAKVHGELVHANFSKWHSNRILTLEEIIQNDSYHVNICAYEIVCGRCQCISLSKLPLHGRLSAFDWSLLEDKLLLCDYEKSLLIYDLNKNTTLVTNTLFVVKEAAWHPSGMIASVIGSHGSFQCFDAALTIIKLDVYDDDAITSNIIDFSKLLYPKKLAQNLLWQNLSSKSSTLYASDVFNEVSDSLLIYFEHGTLIFIKFSFGCISKNILSPLELISQYLKFGSIDEAVCILQCLNWCQQAELCYQCLSKVANTLLRRPITSQTESALELSLGSFYNSVSSLPETILYDYHQQIDHIARRFFHQLLRYHRFEKAFLLAVDLQFRDLFLDLHHVAKQKNETMLAIVSLKHAEELDISDSSSYDQSDTFEESESSCSSTQEELKDQFRKDSDITRHQYIHPVQLEFESCLTQSLIANSESPTMDFRTISNDKTGMYSALRSNSNYPLSSKNTEIHDSSLSSSKFVNFKFSSTHESTYLSQSQHSDFVNLNFEDDMHSIQKLSISNQSNRDDSPIQSNKISSKKRHSFIQSENLEEDENVEGKQVKFVHFGIV